MDLTCRKCNKKYYISENKLDDKKVYFDCECGHRVVVDRRNDVWSDYVAFKKDSLSAGSILDALFFSFNLKNVLVVAFFMFSILSVVGISTIVIINNLQFFVTHPLVSFIIGVPIILIIQLLYDFMLYLISKNVFHLFEDSINIKFLANINDILSDLKVVSFFSIVGSGVLAVLIFPMYFLILKNGIIYSGIIFPILLTTSVFIVLSSVFRNYIFSYVALSRNHKVISVFKQFVSFLKIENINLIVFSFISSLILKIMGLLLFGFFVVVLSFLFSMISIPYLWSGLSGLTFQEISKSLLSMGGGQIVILFFIGLTIFFIISYLISLYQTLISFSMKIMEDKPGRSIPRNVLLVTISLVVLFFMIALLSSHSNFINIITSKF